MLATSSVWTGTTPLKRKKNDVVEYLEEFNHAGLLINGPPAFAGLPFV
jgi:hypothetical protein